MTDREHRGIAHRFRPAPSLPFGSPLISIRAGILLAEGASAVTSSAGAAAVNPIEAFETLDLRVGRILRVEPNERARKPAYKLWLDFGPMGERTSSAQLRALYTAEELVGRLVVAAVNLGTRNIAGFTSEVLVLGLPDERGEVVLLAAEREVPLGGRVY
jgi:tRNA-binding protein